MPASIANLLAEKDPVFSEEVFIGAILVNFENLRQFSRWLLTAECFSDKIIPFELRNFLPRSLRSQSARDPMNKSLDYLLLRARKRFDWVLEQNDGYFIATVIASDGHSSHVVGVNSRRRLVFDHEDPKSLPFKISWFDSTCGGTNTCVGLGEVKIVGLTTKKHCRSS